MNNHFNFFTTYEFTHFIRSNKAMKDKAGCALFISLIKNISINHQNNNIVSFTENKKVFVKIDTNLLGIYVFARGEDKRTIYRHIVKIRDQLVTAGIIEFVTIYDLKKYVTKGVREDQTRLRGKKTFYHLKCESIKDYLSNEEYNILTKNKKRDQK